MVHLESELFNPSHFTRSLCDLQLLCVCFHRNLLEWSATLMSSHILKANYPISELQITSATGRLRPRLVKELRSSFFCLLCSSGIFRVPSDAAGLNAFLKKESTHFPKSFNPNWAGKQAAQVNSFPFLSSFSHVSLVCLVLFSFQPLVECK